MRAEEGDREMKRKEKEKEGKNGDQFFYKSTRMFFFNMRSGHFSDI